MSGSLMGGVDSGIALRAGQGLAPPANPIATLGQFANVKNALNQNDFFPGEMELQRQSIQQAQVNNAKLATQVTAGAMLDAIADPNFTLSGITNRAAAVEHQAHVPTGYFLAALGGIQAAPDTPEWRAAVSKLVRTHAQTDAGAATEQAFGTRGQQNQGGELVSGVYAPAAEGGGFAGSTRTRLTLTPGEQANQTTHPATEAEAKALGVAVGTPVTAAMATQLMQQGMGHLLPQVGGAAPQGGGAAPPATSADTRARAQVYHDGLVARGFDDQTAWALSARAVLESGATVAPKGSNDGGLSSGSMQWNGDRRRDYRKLFGHDPAQGTIDEHLDFIKWESQNTEKAAFDKIAAAQGVGAKGEAVSLHYIRPGKTDAIKAAEAARTGALARQYAGSSQSTASPNQFAGPGAPPGDSAPAVLDRLRSQQAVRAEPLPPPGVGRAIATGPAPGAIEDVGASNKQFLEARAQQADYPLHIQPLEQAARLLKDTKTGRGQETINKFQGYIKSLAPPFVQNMLPGYKPDEVTNFDQAVKYLAQIAAGQPGAQGSDLRTQMAHIANPSTTIDNKAAQYVVNSLIGMERMKRAQYLDFAKQNTDEAGRIAPGVGADYAHHAIMFSRNYHPYGFSWDNMDQSHRDEIGAGLDVAQKAQLAKSILKAREHKLSSAPR